MKDFIKNNYALVAGIALPVLLMVFFLIAGKAAEVSVPGPQYDALFMSDYYEGSDPVFLVRVEEGKMTIRARPNKNDYRPAPPKLWRYDHVTGISTPIAIDFENIKNGLVVDSYMDVVNKNKLNTSTISPDGYSFQPADYDYSGWPGEILGIGRSYRYKADYALVKKSRVVPLNPTQYVSQVKFLAWIEQ